MHARNLAVPEIMCCNSTTPVGEVDVGDCAGCRWRADLLHFAGMLRLANAATAYAITANLLKFATELATKMVVELPREAIKTKTYVNTKVNRLTIE